MKHLAQRIVLGLAFIAQAAFGGASARAQLFVPPSEKILPALDLSAAAPVAAATSAPVKSATITSTAATLDPKKRDPLPPILEAPSVIATRGPATVRARIGFLKEAVVPGAEVVALLILESDQIVGDVEVSVVLPAGLIYSAPDTKATRFDAATRTLTWSGLSADRRASFHPFGLKVASGTNGVLLSLRPFGAGTPDRRIVGSASTLRVGGRVQAKQIDLRGGALAAAEGRTHLEFPPGSVDAETVFTITEVAADADAGQSALLRRNETDDEAEAGAASDADTLIQFDISPSMQFSEPVTVTVALDGLLTPEMLVGGTRIPVLRYLSERVITATEGITDGLVTTATMVVAEEMPADYDPNTGLLVAHLAHFSAWEVALSDVQTPKTWKLLPQSGSVNAFRGSSSYGYPIPAPGMADGLQPNLSLQYSSAAADRDAQDDANLGVGWSMDLPRVYQSVKSEGTWNSNSNQTVYATWETYADGTRVFHPAYYYSAPNNIGDCWSESGCSGLTIWYWVSIATLTAINDYRLSMNGQEHYLVPLAGEFGEYVFEDYSPVRVFKCQGGQTCGGQPAVAGVPAANSYWQVWTADGTRYVFGSDGVDAERRFWANSTTVVQSWYLRRVYGAHRDSPTTPIAYSAEYTYTRPGSDCSGGCVDKPLRLDRVVYGNALQPNQQRSDVYSLTLAYADNGAGALRPTTITATAGISTVGRTAIAYSASREPMTLTQEAWNEAGAVKSLPPITLEYVDGKYLSAVNTGYGGRQEFAYITSTVGAGNPRLVGELRVLDNTGTGAATNWKSVTTYAYAGGCASTMNAVCRAGHDDNNPSGILMGFASVIETAWTDATSIATVNASSFYVDTPRLGRVRERRVLDGENRTLQLTRHDYDVSGGRDGAELPPASRLVVLTRTTTWDGDETAGTYRRIDYDFYGTGRPAMVNLYRGWRDAPHNRHWIAGYPLSTREYTWTLLATPLAGTVPMYSCWFPSPNALFPSAYENCEGQTKNGLVGYAWLTQVTGTVPLDRCASANGDHLIPLSSSECASAGFTVETNPSPHQGYGYPPTRGGASSASGQPVANEPIGNAFDRSVNTKWVTTFTAGSTWLAYDFGGETVYTPTTYRIASANDGPPRDPKSWNLQGSNDGITWTGVDTRTNQSFANRYTYASYTIAAPVGFKRFRLLFQENNGSTETFLGGTGLIQLSEFDLGDTPVYAPDPLLGQPKEIREYASATVIRRTNVEYATGRPS